MTVKLVLRVRASDRPGVMAALAPLVAAHDCDIRSAAVYGDEQVGRFFCRMEIVSRKTRDELAALIKPVADDLSLDWELRDLGEKMKVLIAVSRFGHCLADLIYKSEIGQLPVNIVGVVSNHEAMREISEWHHLSYYYMPINDDKLSQERRFLDLVDKTDADLVILARYMQILSDQFSEKLRGRCINIHHSFLPSFKGAKPYHQAHARGVKLIGATAHFVTPELDEGPIIEQDVRRVDHAITADDMVNIGREIEASVLSRAVRWAAEHRIFENGHKTVVL